LVASSPPLGAPQTPQTPPGAPRGGLRSGLHGGLRGGRGGGGRRLGLDDGEGIETKQEGKIPSSGGGGGGEGGSSGGGGGGGGGGGDEDNMHPMSLLLTSAKHVASVLPLFRVATAAPGHVQIESSPLEWAECGECKTWRLIPRDVLVGDDAEDELVEWTTDGKGRVRAVEHSSKTCYPSCLCTRCGTARAQQAPAYIAGRARRKAARDAKGMVVHFTCAINRWDSSRCWCAAPVETGGEAEE
jgi:hypothetical protein